MVDLSLLLQQDQEFSYGDKPATFGEGGPAQIQETGILNDWFFNMFAGMIDVVQSPLLPLGYIVCLVALVSLRSFAQNPVKFCGVALIYIFSVVQSFALFKTSHFVVDFTPAGWQVTAKSLWFAALFTVIMVWGMSRALQYALATIADTGLGALLAPLAPSKLLDKFRASEKDLEDIEGSAKNPKRQNTAIMFTDIVGYSAQMGKNEAATLAKLKIHNEIMNNQIVRNRGSVIKTIGDAFMVKYRSAESAVQCALDCQKAIATYNKTKTNPDDQFHIRIGIHMGEVTITGSDAFGEGVNIAARTEPKADPDGICVTDVIANAARNKVPAHFSSIGRLPMKNIANPPEFFKVYTIEEQAASPVKAKAGAAGAPAAAGGSPGGTFKI